MLLLQEAEAHTRTYVLAFPFRVFLAEILWGASWVRRLEAATGIALPSELPYVLLEAFFALQSGLRVRYVKSMRTPPVEQQFLSRLQQDLPILPAFKTAVDKRRMFPGPGDQWGWKVCVGTRVPDFLIVGVRPRGMEWVKGVAIEIDGGIHELPGKWDKDLQMETLFKEAGIFTLRIQNAQVTHRWGTQARPLLSVLETVLGLGPATMGEMLNDLVALTLASHFSAAGLSRALAGMGVQVDLEAAFRAYASSKYPDLRSEPFRDALKAARRFQREREAEAEVNGGVGPSDRAS